VRRILEYFLYCPAVRPSPFPEPRRLAYENGSGRIPDPDDAPDAWETLPPVEVAGTLLVIISAELSLLPSYDPVLGLLCIWSCSN
jgi:hypothetical protein